jgi:predicted GNAT family acetyltransferase
VSAPIIEHSEGVYFVANPDQPSRYLAEMTYEWRDGVMAILHTGVREALRGQGVAGHLLARAVADARHQGVKILPLCEYVRGRFDAHPERYSDLRA